MKIGNTDITNPIIGTTEINKVFIGLNKVWERLSFLLDSLTGSTGAFSLRLLSSSYTGDAIQVRRASDNTTQDIGFVNNQLDTASLNTFCSGTNGFVSIWYNQSDVSNNAIQTTAANQPKIYDSVNGVELENGKPTIKFIKSSSTWLEVADNSFGHLSDSISNFSVSKGNIGTSNFPTLFSKGYNVTGCFTFYMQNATYELRLWAGNVNYATGYNSFLGSQRLLSSINATGVSTSFVNINSASIGSYSLTTTSGTNAYKWAIGRNNRDSNYYWDGNIQEILLFNNNQTSDINTIESNINTNYTIY
tara:strand:+ start:64 stop:978 length:915 start_codon:yes stop_codon:yes gene_type:complete